MKNKFSKEICLMGGLGNQLFQFAYGRYISRYGLDDLILDTSHSSTRKSKGHLPDICEVLGMETFYIKNRSFGKIGSKARNLAIRSSTNNLFRARVGRAVSRQVLGFSLNHSSNFTRGRIELNLAKDLGDDKEELTISNKNVYFIGYCQTEKYFSKILSEDELMKKKWSEFVLRSSDRWKNLAPRESAILHIRRGDYKSSNFGVLSAEYYRSALDLAKKTKGFSRIYAVSDESSRELSGELKEISKDIEFIESADLGPASVLGLIAQFKVIVGANSSLSWWAAALGGIVQESRVIFPQPWFQKTASPRNLLLPKWVTVGGDIWKKSVP